MDFGLTRTFRGKCNQVVHWPKPQTGLSPNSFGHPGDILSQWGLISKRLKSILGKTWEKSDLGSFSKNATYET